MGDALRGPWGQCSHGVCRARPYPDSPIERSACYVSPRASLSSTILKTPPIEFKKLKEIVDLPEWLGVGAARIHEFLEHPERCYTKIRLAKKNKKHPKSAVRIVYKVDKELAALQRHIARSIALTPLGSFPEYVQGFVGGRSIATNAEKHRAKKLVLCVDLKDFFESIHRESVQDIFRLLGCGKDAAAALASLCTLGDSLPQGASSSPILSNLAARTLDADMLILGQVSQCAYSRYADDMTFSGDTVPIEEQIDEAAKKNGFSINHDKTLLQPRGRRQYVTGLTVCDPVRPRVPRRFKKNLRLALRCAEKYGLNKHCANSGDEPQQLWGRISYVNGIEPELGKQFLKQYHNAIAIDRRSTE